MKPEIVEKIEQIITACTPADYDEAIADSTIPELYLQLSSLKNGMFVRLSDAA